MLEEHCQKHFVQKVCKCQVTQKKEIKNQKKTTNLKEMFVYLVIALFNIINYVVLSEQ